MLPKQHPILQVSITRDACGAVYLVASAFCKSSFYKSAFCKPAFYNSTFYKSSPVQSSPVQSSPLFTICWTLRELIMSDISRDQIGYLNFRLELSVMIKRSSCRIILSYFGHQTFELKES